MTSKTSLFFLLLISFLVISCGDDEDLLVDDFTDPTEIPAICDLSDSKIIQKDYQFADARPLNSTPPVISFSRQSCVDSLCSFFQIDFSDSPNYSLDFLLLEIVDSMALDTLQGTETGTYSIDYCESSIPSQLGGPTRTGTITLNPLDASFYQLSFYHQSNLFKLNDFKVKGRVLEVFFPN